jgi:hypothetical protein
MSTEKPDIKDFLTLKSTDQQKKEGAKQIVDTAFVKEIKDRLMLVAVFDAKYFDPDEKPASHHVTSALVIEVV